VLGIGTQPITNAAPAAQHLESLRRLPLHHDQAIGQTSETAENDIFIRRQRPARHDPGLPLALRRRKMAASIEHACGSCVDLNNADILPTRRISICWLRFRQACI
jgi:hypothetical protein